MSFSLAGKPSTEHVKTLPGDFTSKFSRFVPAKIPVELQIRFRELKAEYALMQGVQPVPPVIASILQVDEMQAVLPDLFVLERGYAAALPDAFVPGAVQRWRECYRNIVGDGQYANYLSTKPVDPGDADLGTKMFRLRADLCWLIDRVHYLYTIVPAKERIQNRISYRLAWLTIISFLVFGGVILAVTYPFGDKDMPLKDILANRHLWGISASTILGAMFFGLLGGFISAQTRLQTPTGTEPFFKKQELWESRWIINIISPLSGAIFALVLYFIFAAGIIGNSAIFPSFLTPKDLSGSGFGEFFSTSLPASGSSVAKIVVWSFIAGFAERFVPSVLSRLASDDYLGTQKKS